MTHSGGFIYFLIIKLGKICTNKWKLHFYGMIRSYIQITGFINFLIILKFTFNLCKVREWKVNDVLNHTSTFVHVRRINSTKNNMGLHWSPFDVVVSKLFRYKLYGPNRYTHDSISALWNLVFYLIVLYEIESDSQMTFLF